MRPNCTTRSTARAPQQLQLNMQEVANNLNISLSSSEQVSPNFWTDPKNGIPYFMAVQTPEYRIADKNQLDNTPLAAGVGPHRHANANRSRQCRDRAARRRSVRLQSFEHSGRSTTSTAAFRTKISAAWLGGPQDCRRTSNRSSSPATTLSFAARFESMASGLRQPDAGPLVRRRIRLHADGRQLPELRGSARRHPRAAGGWRRHPADVVRDRNDLERALAHGRHHGDRRRLGEFDPAGHFCSRAARSRHERHRCSPVGRRHAVAAGADDRRRR